MRDEPEGFVIRLAVLADVPRLRAIMDAAIGVLMSDVLRRGLDVIDVR